MNETTRKLIAVGASLTANCRQCLKYHAGKAREHGATEREISEAVEIAAMVRKGASTSIDRFAESLHSQAPAHPESEEGGCGCG